MNLNELSSQLTGANKRIRENMLVALNTTTKELQRELRSRAPVYSGAFRASWRVQRARISGDTIQAGVFNRRKYAPVIEGGSIPGKPPWPSAETEGGKVIEQDGRIWSKKAPGGTIEPMFREEHIVQTIYSRVLSAAVKGLF